MRHAAGDGPEHAGARPGHTFQNAAAADARIFFCPFIVVIVAAHGSISLSP
jgi:hypothetical protein